MDVLFASPIGTMKQSINIVWLKRDLRLQDHLPFASAEEDPTCDYLAIYLFEPSLLSAPDNSVRHQRFVYQSLMEINRKLSRYQRSVQIYHGEALQVFNHLSHTYAINAVYSYQESGTQLTWDRDMAVAKSFNTQQIKWIEYQRDGVIRGIKNRSQWDAQWQQAMTSPQITPSYTQSKIAISDTNNPFALEAEYLQLLSTTDDNKQYGGTDYGWKYLRSFMEERGKSYARSLSKPLQSRTSCSRISPYLAWGNLSLRQVYQYVAAHDNRKAYGRNATGLLTRLHWHCHFIQKFEVECAYETHCINRGYESLSYANDPTLITAWENGMTGLPLVDACMRCLHQTGWVNFRMRAMLVSVFCHHLDCDWRHGVYHLARLFLDYEPGIHYPQWQMQAGTTGVNTIRMYNPIKQSYDHDPEGFFIKEWVPELRDVPTQFVHEPWKMTALDRQFAGVTIDYPDPIVDVTQAARYAREKLWGHRENTAVISENRRILKTHVRPNSRKRRNLKSTS